MKSNSIILSLVDNYEKLTTVEKRIADFFIDNKTKGDFSSKNLTNTLFVSEASLSRFAQKCGYRGYREFIFKYEEGFMSIRTEEDSQFQDVYHAYHLLLKQSLDMIDAAQIKKCSEMIFSAKHILVCGIGSSALVAKEMKLRFMRLGILVEYVDQSDEMKVRSVLVNKDSLVIGLSLQGKKEEVLIALEQAHQNNAKTMLITGNYEDTFSFIEEKILVPSFKNLNYGNIISPQFPLQIIIDLFYRYLLTREQSGNEFIKTHQKTLEALDESGKE